MILKFFCLPLTASLVLGCEGNYELRVFGEAFVEQGIPADMVRDRWKIEFTEFVVSIGDVAVVGDERVGVEGSFVFDLTQPSEGIGHLLADMEAPTGNYSVLRYRIDAPGEVVGGNASQKQIDHLVTKKTALHVVGRASRDTKTIAFDWDFPISFGHYCKLDERVGASHGGSTQLTIHADHLLLDDLGPHGEISFDLIAASDADSDGRVTLEEMAKTSILPQERYQTAGLPIEDLWRYVGNLALTLGHVDGEGGCDPIYVPDRYGGLENPGIASGRGAELFAAHCASCHGADGAGDGPAAAGMNPRPTDLTTLAHEVVRDDYLYFRIAEGGAFFPYASAMPGLGDDLDEADIWALVNEVYAIRHGH